MVVFQWCGELDSNQRFLVCMGANPVAA